MCVYVMANALWQSTIPTAPGDKVDAFDLLMARNVIVYFCMFYGVAILQACMAASLVCHALGNWNKGNRDGLLIKLARSCVELQRPKTEQPI